MARPTVAMMDADKPRETVVEGETWVAMQVAMAMARRAMETRERPGPMATMGPTGRVWMES